MANKEHLAILKQGAEAWHEWREENDLIRPDLNGANLSDANLSGANLSGANLSGANLRDADLSNANLTKANLSNANLTKANLSNANLKRTALRGAALFGTDLRGVKGIVLDGNDVMNARFDSAPKDPWSVLRRKYTGPMFLFHLLFLILFFGAYAVRATMWIGVNFAQESLQTSQQQLVRELGELKKSDEAAVTLLEEKLAGLWKQKKLTPESLNEAMGLVEQSLRQSGMWVRTAAVEKAVKELAEIKQCLQKDCEEWPLWKVLLNVDRGQFYWVLAAALLIYNILRGLLTHRVGLMRDAEERSHHAPAKSEYIWQSRAHRFVMWPLFWVAVGALLVSFHPETPSY